MPACFSMLLSVPIGISRTGCGTVTRPGFTECLNCLWLPTWATSYQPSCFNRWMTSRLDITYDTHFLHTYQTRSSQDACVLQRGNGRNGHDPQGQFRHCRCLAVVPHAQSTARRPCPKHHEVSSRRSPERTGHSMSVGVSKQTVGQALWAADSLMQGIRSESPNDPRLRKVGRP